MCAHVCVADGAASVVVGSIGGDGWNDGVEAVGVTVGGEELLLPRLARAPARWGAGRQGEMLEDPMRNPLIFDHGDHLHPARAARTDENLESPGPLHQRRPIQPSLPGVVVGACKVISERRASLLFPQKLSGAFGR